MFSGETAAPAGGPRTTRLYQRALAEAEAVTIPGTEGATYPFFSPDGAWVGFAAGNTLKKVALSGGPPIDLCTLPFAGPLEGASWGAAGVIVFARRGLWPVADSGGTPESVVEGDPDTRSNVVPGLYAPAILPDGQTVLFTDVPGDGQWKDAHVDAINLTTKQRTTLLTNAADARYSPTGHLVFLRNVALLAVPFDATRVAVTGAAVPLLAGVMQATKASFAGWETGTGQFAVSASGTLLYAPGDRYPTAASTLARVDRQGAATTLAEITGGLLGLRLSPSGTRVAAYKTNRQRHLAVRPAVRDADAAHLHGRRLGAHVVTRWDDRPVSQVWKRRRDLHRAADSRLRAAAPDRGQGRSSCRAGER